MSVRLDRIRCRLMAGLLACGTVLLLAGCGEEESRKPLFSGQLVVTVVDLYGRPTANAQVHASASWNGDAWTSRSTTTDANGLARFGNVPAEVDVGASHPLGTHSSQRREVDQKVPAALTLVLQPSPQPHLSLLSAVIPPESVDASRSELDLHLSFAASSPRVMLQFSYEWSSSFVGLALCRFDDAFYFVDREFDSGNVPSCGVGLTAPDGASSHVGLASTWTQPVIKFVQNDAVPAEPYSAVLLLDQSRRAASLDGHLRSFAAKSFIRRARPAPVDDQVVVAAFAATDAVTASLLPATPFWVPTGAAGAFASSLAAQEVAADGLETLVGGVAPVLAALGQAFDLLEQVPSGRQRAVVALLGGGDDSALDDAQWREAVQALRHKQDALGIRTILVVNAAGESAAIARYRGGTGLARTLGARLIETRDGNPYGGLDFAADMLAGGTPTMDLSLHLKAVSAGAFAAASTLDATAYQVACGCFFAGGPYRLGWRRIRDVSAVIP